MAAKKKTTKSFSASQKVGIGVGLTAAAVAAAGAYFLTGAPNAKQNRKKVKGWMLKAKGEVLEALEKAEHMTEKEFNDLVANISAGYGKVKDVSKADINAFKKEMKENWPHIVAEGKVVVDTVGKAATKMKKKTKGKARKTAKKAKKTTKKTTKKSTKKSTKSGK